MIGIAASLFTAASSRRLLFDLCKGVPPASRAVGCRYAPHVRALIRQPQLRLLGPATLAYIISVSFSGAASAPWGPKGGRALRDRLLGRHPDPGAALRRLVPGGPDPARARDGADGGERVMIQEFGTTREYLLRLRDRGRSEGAGTKQVWPALARSPTGPAPAERSGTRGVRRPPRWGRGPPDPGASSGRPLRAFAGIPRLVAIRFRRAGRVASVAAIGPRAVVIASRAVSP